MLAIDVYTYFRRSLISLERVITRGTSPPIHHRTFILLINHTIGARVALSFFQPCDVEIWLFKNNIIQDNSAWISALEIHVLDRSLA